MNALWLVTLSGLYLFFIFSTPLKAPPPIRVEVKVEETQLQADKTEATPSVEPSSEVAAEPVDIEKGKTIYLSTCTKCHNKDPNVKGSVGPEMVDAPIEVMMHKVATGRYPDVIPEGFVPKRKTKLMTKFPQLVKDVPSIHAYVQSVKKKK